MGSGLVFPSKVRREALQLAGRAEPCSSRLEGRIPGRGGYREGSGGVTLELGFWAGDMELLWGAKAPLSSRPLNTRAFLGLSLMWKKPPGGRGWGLSR